MNCQRDICAAVGCHFSHAADSFLFSIRRTAPPPILFANVMSACTCCHFSHAADTARFSRRLIAPASMNCWQAISAAVDCHFSHAMDSFLFSMRRIAPPPILFANFMSTHTCCHFCHAADTQHRFRAPASMDCSRAVSAAVDYHCSHAIDSCRFSTRRIALPLTLLTKPFSWQA